MYLSRITYLFALATLPALSNVASAAVHDFGTLQNTRGSYMSPKFTLTNNDFVSSINFNHSTFSSTHSSAAFANSAVRGNGIGLPSYDSNTQFNKGDRFGRNDFARDKRIDDKGGKHKYTPIASPVPEPETYAMILAGLCLIGLTTRRRKHNP